MTCVSFSADGKLLATGGYNAIAYTWDVAAIVRKAGLNDSLSNSTAKKLALHVCDTIERSRRAQHTL
jgi:phosphomevalonate kinase